MSTVIIFAGTTEGRMLSEELSGKQIPVTACVATEYGETLLTENRYLKVHAGRMDREQIAGFIQREGAGLVVDAHIRMQRWYRRMCHWHVRIQKFHISG